MIVGVIGSGAIGPDLAYGFVSALASTPGARVYLVDIRQDALDAGMKRIGGYVKKGVARGKLSAKAAAAIEQALIPTLDIKDLKDCEYVLEAATEQLPIKQRILADLEDVVSSDCLIGFATSGLPRAQILDHGGSVPPGTPLLAATVRHPERCFVNHPFFPAWRSPPVEVVLSGDDALGQRMIDTLKRLGKVPVVTADVACFAADDIFCNYCSEAARLVEEGVATPAQIDRIVNEALGGGGPLNVLDLTRGNLLTAHCQQLMEEAPTGSSWFTPPQILTTQGNDPWHDRSAPGDSSHDEALKSVVLNRILAVLLARTWFVVDNDICAPAETNWLTRMALGFTKGLLEVSEDLGAERVHEICTTYAAANPGFEVPQSIASKTLPRFRHHVLAERDGDVAVVTIWRPEVLNALNGRVMRELGEVLDELEADDGVRGVVLTGYEGSLAGADVMELAVLETVPEAEALVRRGQAVINKIPAMSKPVVAALDGPTMGGGAELSMACHARVVGRKLIFSQPEVNLGIVPGYGGTQRLPRLIGLERALNMLRLGTAIRADKACAWGWATGEPGDDTIAAAKQLIGRHLEGDVTLAPVDEGPFAMPDTLPGLYIGRRSRRIDAILMNVLRTGLPRPLAEGLAVEMTAVGECTQVVDFDIGMKNFIQNGPRVPAVFLHE